jgi:hypothetical protein
MVLMKLIKFCPPVKIDDIDTMVFVEAFSELLAAFVELSSANKGDDEDD